jgi:hypothetical protein
MNPPRRAADGLGRRAERDQPTPPPVPTIDGLRRHETWQAGRAPPARSLPLAESDRATRLHRYQASNSGGKGPLAIRRWDSMPLAGPWGRNPTKHGPPSGLADGDYSALAECSYVIQSIAAKADRNKRNARRSAGFLTGSTALVPVCLIAAEQFDSGSLWRSYSADFSLAY